VPEASAIGDAFGSIDWRQPQGTWEPQSAGRQDTKEHFDPSLRHTHGILLSMMEAADEAADLSLLDREGLLTLALNQREKLLSL
jgi:hypothetical protein